MDFIKIFADESGNSKFGWGEIGFQMRQDGVSVSDLFPVEDITFVKLPGGTVFDWHNAPRSQWIFQMNGKLKIEVSDGAKKIIEPGTLVYVDDVAGRGHRTEVLSSEDVIIATAGKSIDVE